MEFAEFIKSPTVDNVILHKPFEFPVEGTLCVTGFHLVLSSRQKHKEELWVSTFILFLICKNLAYRNKILLNLELFLTPLGFHFG